MNIPIARISLSETEINSVLEPLKNGWLVQGPKVREFEDKWSAFTGHSIAVTSFRTVLHQYLAAIRIDLGYDYLGRPRLLWLMWLINLMVKL